MSDEAKTPNRRRLNLDQKTALKAVEIARFATGYGRKAQKRVEPNDRNFDKAVARKAHAMDPEDFDRYLRDDED